MIAQANSMREMIVFRAYGKSLQHCMVGYSVQTAYPTSAEYLTQGEAMYRCWVLLFCVNSILFVALVVGTETIGQRPDT